ncbi:hypothetical protein GGS20DRAFT_584112 [Poronia punctata]|nr:hypothetical protein GGS20DRAFT_584112 [Poronia punctata]
MPVSYTNHPLLLFHSLIFTRSVKDFHDIIPDLQRAARREISTVHHIVNNTEDLDVGDAPARLLSGSSLSQDPRHTVLWPDRAREEASIDRDSGRIRQIIRYSFDHGSLSDELQSRAGSRMHDYAPINSDNHVAMDHQNTTPDSYKEAVGDYYPGQDGPEVVYYPPKPVDGLHPYHATQATGYYGAQGYPTSGYPGSGPGPGPVQERTILGLRRPTFFLSVALAIVIIAAAVGGGVGGSMAVENAKNVCTNSNGTISAENDGGSDTATVTATVTVTATAIIGPSGTSTTTPTATEPIVVPTGVVKSECPDIEDEWSITLGRDTWIFSPVCAKDYNGGDFGAVIAYSFHDCLQACAAHNHFSGKDVCNAVSFQANQTAAIEKDFGNCWLKGGEHRILNVQNGPRGSPDWTISALLKDKNRSR